LVVALNPRWEDSRLPRRWVTVPPSPQSLSRHDSLWKGCLSFPRLWEETAPVVKSLPFRGGMRPATPRGGYSDQRRIARAEAMTCKEKSRMRERRTRRRVRSRFFPLGHGSTAAIVTAEEVRLSNQARSLPQAVRARSDE